MTVSNALGHGIRAVNRNRWMIALYYAAATVPALIGTAVVMAPVMGSLGSSLWAGRMASNLDLDWFGEMAAGDGLATLTPVIAAIAGIGAAVCLIRLFLLGGTVEIFAQDQSFSAREFFGGCGRHFWRLVRLALCALVFAAVALAVGRLISSIGQRLWGEGSEATPLVYWAWFRTAVTLALLALVNLAFDYGAIRLVREDSRKSIRAILGAFGMVWRNPARLIGLYAAVTAFTLAAMAAGFAAYRLAPRTSVFLVLIALVLQQLAVAARIWPRLLYYSSQCAMYEDLRPEPVAEPEPQLEEPDRSAPEATTAEIGPALVEPSSEEPREPERER